MMMIRWKAPVFVVTSVFLLCCELYGWTSERGSQDGVEGGGKEKVEDDNLELVREEDFPTLKEWLEDREVLYQERAR